jgi:hypothetical protein
MPYIPKNKIQSGLFANLSGPPYFKTKQGTRYVGEYYKLYNGKFFSGKGPNDPNTSEIFKIEDVNDPNPAGYIVAPTEPIPSLLSVSVPTPQDYKNGFFTRYFSVKRNQFLYFEINKDTYTKFQQKNTSMPWQLYRVFSLVWELTGDVNKVAQTNRNVVLLTEKKEKAFGLGKHLKENWAQYYRETP